MSSLLRVITPRITPARFGTVVESMLDGTYRVNIDGKTRRIASAIITPPSIGSQVVVTVVGGKESITSLGFSHGTNITEVIING